MNSLRGLPEQLSRGQIGWASVADSKGHIKNRPIVIITDTNEIVLDRPIIAVAVTTSFPDPPAKAYVELPWHPRRHPATRLARRSAAVCNWLIELLPSQIIEIKGYVPTKTLLRIIEQVRELNTNE